VSRLRVLAGVVALLTLLAGVAALAEWLRHPPTIAPVPGPPDPGDPRAEVVCPAPPVGSAPVRVSSNDLYDCPHSYDGNTVTFEGEVIGAVLDRRDGAWLQLNDDAYAGDLGPLPAHRELRGANSGVGVHLPTELAERIQWAGSHRARGDVLTVTGVYHQSDPVSGEVAVIRATAGDIARTGAPLAHERLRGRQVVGALVGLAALALLAAGRLAARRP
jgi:hypothetical protein